MPSITSLTESQMLLSLRPICKIHTSKAQLSKRDDLWMTAANNCVLNQCVSTGEEHCHWGKQQATSDPHPTTREGHFSGGFVKQQVFHLSPSVIHSSLVRNLVHKLLGREMDKHIRSACLPHLWSSRLQAIKLTKCLQRLSPMGQTKHFWSLQKVGCYQMYKLCLCVG